MIQFLYEDRHGRWYFCQLLNDAHEFSCAFGAIGLQWNDTYGGFKFLLL